MKNKLVEYEVEKEATKQSIKRERDNVKAFQSKIYKEKKVYKQ